MRKNLIGSRCSLFKSVFVMQSTWDRPLLNCHIARNFVSIHFPRYSSFRHWIGNARTKAHVRPFPIVVCSPFSKQRPKVALTDRNEPIQTLSP